MISGTRPVSTVAAMLVLYSTVPVEVREAGPFAVAVQVDAGGQTSRAVLPVTLDAGQQTVTVPLRGAPPTAIVKGIQLFDNRTALIPIDSR